MSSEDDCPFDDPVPMPIDGELDLHGIRPKDVKEVLLEYLLECRKAEILEVRVIHGKGIGEIRRSVQHILSTAPNVQRFADASRSHGGWGATMVYLTEA
ncbi:MAG: DNA-nicking Smr family endonuclease [Limisphaerales bacterium]|jgi:DNA-nicking Smr family endonuclease